jgi:murein DD-endopeptidase MepM/ murein hydrolase activator NlpD
MAETRGPLAAWVTGLAAWLAAGAGGVWAADAAVDSSAWPSASPSASGSRAGAAETLAAREAILGDQAAMARITARWRARELYRVLRSGDRVALSDADRARVMAAGARALAREQHEERLLLAERDQARAEQARLRSPDAGGWPAVEIAGRLAAPQTPAGTRRAPRFVAPVRGALRSRFGSARDPATGAWFSRAGVRIQARAGEPVRAAAAGVVRRVVAASALGPALVIDHGGGWMSVLANLELIAAPNPDGDGARTLAPGARVAAGQVVGRVGDAPGGVICELWRGQTPVDPAAHIRFHF